MNPAIIHLKNGFSKLIIEKNKEATYIMNKDSLLLPMNTDKITSLNLSNCNLIELPEWFTFNNLIDVDLSCNQFETVPSLILAENRKIETLNLSNNKLTTFDVKPKCCSSLIELNLSDNYLTHIPIWVYSVECGDLETLKLNNNPCVHQVHLMARYMKRLKTLELNNANVKFNNQLNNRYLMEIPKLEKLSLSNILNKNPNSIKELSFKNYAFTPFLKELHLSGLGISIIPDDFIILESLEVLNLKKNYLTWFPENFTLLTHLKVLNVSENELVSLPDDIGKLVHLNTLLMSENCIGTLPVSMKQLEHLKILDCYKNDLTEDILDIIKCIPSLSKCDYEQNMFEVQQDDVNLMKRDKLREEHGFMYRFNGRKILHEDISDSKSYYSDSSDEGSESCPEAEDVNVDVNVDVAEENWDCDSEHSITDDMDLVIPKFRFYIKDEGRRPCSRNYFDPLYFEDAESN